MKKLVLSVALVATVLGMTAATAQAISFTGSVDYGTVNVPTPPGGYLGAPPRFVTLLGPGGLGNPEVQLVTGNLAGFLAVNDTITHAPITFSPKTFPITPLWSHSSGVVFDLTTFDVVLNTNNILVMTGAGVFRCTGPCVGYDNTDAMWNMSLNIANGETQGSFSSSASVPIPEPGLLALLGLGLIGLARSVRSRR